MGWDGSKMVAAGTMAGNKVDGAIRVDIRSTFEKVSGSATVT